MGHRHVNIPVFVPELSCPHQCVFCNQNKITGKSFVPDPTDINQTIEQHLSTIDKDNTTVEVAFFGGNFTGIPVDLQLSYLREANKYISAGSVNEIRISTRPDFIDHKSLLRLKEYNVKTIELGAQSFDNGVLNKSGRGHTAEQTREAAKLVKEYGFNLGLQMMVGLPGDTPQKAFETAKEIIALGANNTRIYPVIVIKDTYLEKIYLDGTYKALTIDEAVNTVKPIYKLFTAAGITILRVGLHPSEGILFGNEFIAGPYHVSFREMVITEIWYDKFMAEIDFTFGGRLEIYTRENSKNSAAGFKAVNKKRLLEKFDTVKFCTDNTLAQNDCYYRYIR